MRERKRAQARGVCLERTQSFQRSHMLTPDRVSGRCLREVDPLRLIEVDEAHVPRRPDQRVRPEVLDIDPTRSGVHGCRRNSTPSTQRAACLGGGRRA